MVTDNVGAVLKWNFHQEGVAGYARLSNIVLKGVENGAAGEVILCPPGFFSDDASATACEICPPGI